MKACDAGRILSVALVVSLTSCSGVGGNRSSGGWNGGWSTGAPTGSPGPNTGTYPSGGYQGGYNPGGNQPGGSYPGGSYQGGNSGDPLESARQTCIDRINELRATKGLAPLVRWREAEPCIDQQATYDEQKRQGHAAFSERRFPSCNGFAQNECLGGGANGIRSCLQAMWNEKDQAGCRGCDACTNPGGCAQCDVLGSSTGVVCGHYVAMSSRRYTMAACGFSSLGGWAAINFK